MTQEEKLKEAQRLYKTANTDQRYVLESLFPELKESEDEKIRKEILSALKNANCRGVYDKHIAWLEKQKEQKPVSITDEWIEDYWQHKKVNNPYSYDKGEEIQFDHQGFVRFCKKYCKNPTWSEEDEQIRKHLIRHFQQKTKQEWNGMPVKDILSWLGRQSKVEQAMREVEEKAEAFTRAHEGETSEEILAQMRGEPKPVKKIEPKFHEGEWVILTAGELSTTLQIVKVDTNKRRYYWFNDNSYLPIVDEECLRLWTIQDAKDGDVLCCESGWTCIFKALNSDISFSSYCFMDNTGWFCETGSESHSLEKAFIKVCNGNIYPATKEQRELLFTKMKEAGCEWDADKKELKKIEDKPLVIDEGKDEIDRNFTEMMLKDYTKQKPIMIQWTGDNLKELVHFTGKSPKFEEWFKTWEDFENYVHTHNNIFKIFNEDGSHVEIPVGAWIIKTPDGYNVPSKGIFKQKPVWSEEDEKEFERLLHVLHANMYESFDNWLKLLKDRVQPQNIAYYNPYKEVVESIAKMCKHYDNMDVGSLQDFYDNVKVKCKDAKEYDSLFPQPTWKPSDEQMEILQYLCTTSSHPNKKVIPTLESLLSDLKKLKEE